MTLLQWMHEFAAAHARAKRGELAGPELTEYQAAREELAAVLLAARRIELQPGQKPRRLLRVARALQADLELPDGVVRAVTLDVSAAGIAAVVARPFEIGDELEVTIRIPSGPLHAHARVADRRMENGSARVSFAFVSLDDADAERLVSYVFDVVIAELLG